MNSLKSVTENVKQLAKKIENRPETGERELGRRQTRELDDLKAEIENLKRQQELRENKPKRTPKIGNIREFCPKTESDCISSTSGKKNKHKVLKQIKPIEIREFRLDSSLSQVMRPLDLLRDPKVIEQWGSDSSCIKTPNKKVVEAFKAVPDYKKFLEDDLRSEDSARTPVKRNQKANVKDFDDFKDLLKDLKMSLNMSDFSTFQDNLNEQMVELEKVLTEYSDLDKKMVALADSKLNRHRLNNSFYDSGISSLVEQKKCQSFIARPEAGDKYLRELDLLRQASNLNEYSLKIKELKSNPSDFETVIFRLKKEFGSRRRKFEEIQEFLA